MIRGPGGTVWGANAVNGVISIFTKRAADTPGVIVQGGGGNIDRTFGSIQYGGKLGKGADYRVYAKYFDKNQMADLAGANGKDGWHMLRSGFRMDSMVSSKNTVTTEGNIYAGREGELELFLPSVTSPGFVAIPQQINLGGGFLQSVWNHTSSERSDFSLQGSFSRYRRDDPLGPETRNTFDFDFQHRIAWGSRHDFVWGVGAHFTTDQIGGSLTVSFNPPSRVLQVYNSFVQDEIALLPDRLYLTLGTKLEHNEYTGFEVIPDVRLTWTSHDRQMFWAAISRALRAPSRSDTNLVVNVGGFPGSDGTPVLLRFLGNPQFRDEHLLAYEAGYRAEIFDGLSVDIATYYNDYHDLQTSEPSASFFESTPSPAHEVQTLTYQNLMHGETHGIEIATNWKLTDRWNLSSSYAQEQLHLHTSAASTDRVTPAFVEKGAPRHSAQLRSHLNLHHGLAWDASAYFVDRLSHQAPSTTEVIPAYTRLDTGLLWKVSEGFSISVVGQNLLRDQHLEFQDIFGSVQSSRIKRSGYAKFVWKF